MHGMLQLDAPADFIIATGRSHLLSDVLSTAFEAIGVDDPSGHVRQDPALMRPADVVELYGDPTKAREGLGWAPTLDFAATIGHMVEVDVRRLESGVEEDPAYLTPA
jgi:GDPmannose 4,6-dehydratase